jgi:2-polyprenyl-3-methyl-5-hydroxy-6-metoxy-1,4-benzoquinol methylase
VRDTDADWRELGRSDPYWAVISSDEYHSENLTPARVEEFYLSGIASMADIVRRIELATGARPSGRALDFGCGAGRLAEAMAAYVESVTGYDISPGMLELARSNGGRATYVEVLPDGPFDWINSYIVFQHIPPERGLGLMRELAVRLAPGGVVSLQVTIWREDRHKPPPLTGWRKWLAPLVAQVRNARLPRGTILMHDYDLSAVVEIFNRAGVEDLTLSATDHGGHHGVILIGRKTAHQASA